MKKSFVSMMLGVAAMVALSGCNMTDFGSPYSNMKIEKEGYQEIDKYDVSQVLIKNSANSHFDIVEIYSAPLEGTYDQSFPNSTPPYTISPGASRLFETHNCYDYEVWWKIKIVDEYGNVAEGKYRRQCGFREILRVTNW
jgi:hypothetical protein